MIELRIFITAQLSDDLWDKAKQITAIGEPMRAFTEALKEAGIEATVTHEEGVGEKKTAPRKPRSDAGSKRDSKAPANGVPAEPTPGQELAL